MKSPIIVECRFNKSKEVVWKAITELNQMTQWFFENIPDFKAETGFKTKFNVKAPSRDFMHLWEILEVIDYEKIVYDWRYEGIEGIGKITFNITKENNQTVLTLINEGLESFPQNKYPEFTEESCYGGWNYFLNERLADYLSKL